MRFGEDVVSLVLEQVRNQEPQLQETEALHAAAEVARAPLESNVLSLTPLESVLQGEICQVARIVREIGDKVARMQQVCGRKVEYVPFEHDELQVRLYSKASQFS